MTYYRVTAENGLRIRKLPARGETVLQAMPFGMRVRRLDDTLWNGSWYRILARYSDRYQVEGYAHHSFLAPVVDPQDEIPTAEEVPPPPSVKPKPKNIFTVIATSLRLRDEPGTHGRILMNMPEGTEVTKLEDASQLGWWKVSTAAGSMQEIGYAHSDYLAPLEPEPSGNSDLGFLRNITELANRFQRFVGDHVGNLNARFFEELNPVLERYKINANPRRFSHFIAQLAHESARFTRLEENLNYSAEALLRVFGRYFDNEDEAQAFARQPEKIANRVYANRIGNGDEASGDGWRYRGRGFIQLTGRANYRDIGNRIGVDIEANPELVAEDQKVALLVAADYWDSRNINEAADRDDVFEVTRLINGGHHGLQDRKSLLQRAKSIWGG